VINQSTDEEMQKMVDKLAESISGLCHMVIARRLGQFFAVIGEEVRKPAEVSPEIKQLMKFYDVDTVADVIGMQSSHIERLQAKLPPTPDERPGYVPRGG
jgi:hypothetical protein